MYAVLSTFQPSFRIIFYVLYRYAVFLCEAHCHIVDVLTFRQAVCSSATLHESLREGSIL